METGNVGLFNQNKFFNRIVRHYEIRDFVYVIQVTFNFLAKI